MEMQYIFIKKKGVDVDIKNSNKIFQNMFKIIFDNVTFDTFQFNVGNIIQTVFFKSSTVNEETMYLTLSLQGKPAFSAKTLSNVNDCLIRGQHRESFYIINSYDEVSAYYCENLAPRLGRFERLMRSFIYVSLTRELGAEWFDDSFTDEIKNSIKDKGNISNTDLIERGLYEMTFSQLYDYLFKEFSFCSADSVIYEQLLKQDLNEMDKQEIITIINTCKKESLWNRFFSETQFDLKEPLDRMRDNRNKVAHNKFIRYDEYNECKRNLIKINRVLESAIENLNSNIYTEKHLTDSLMSFVALFAGLLKKNYDVFSNEQKNFNVLGKILIKAVEPIASVSKMNAMYKIGEVISDVQRISEALETNTKTNEELPNFYEESNFDE